VPHDVRALIREISMANSLWGAPRIHGELQKLGISVSQATVAKYMHRRRRPPSQTWRTFLTNHASQMENEPPRYLLHDRDSIFADVAITIAGMNTQAVRTAPQSPWQNGYVERVIGSIRRECLDHLIVMNAAGLQRVLREYVSYYKRARTHLAAQTILPRQYRLSSHVVENLFSNP
jgi:Integrase core domain